MNYFIYSTLLPINLKDIFILSLFIKYFRKIFINFILCRIFKTIFLYPLDNRYSDLWVGYHPNECIY